MGITLAMAVLHGASGGRHGGTQEAIDELIRESFWMTEEELISALAWADANKNLILHAAMSGETARRKTNRPISEREN